jgi:hypothetical protein
MSSLTSAQQSVQEAVLGNPALAGTFQRILDAIRKDGSTLGGTEADILVQAMQALPPVALPDIARSILDSYRYEKGTASLVIPKGVSNKLAKKALNLYFKDTFPGSKRDCLIDMHGMRYSMKEAERTGSRDVSTARTISLSLVLRGGEGVDNRSLAAHFAAMGYRLSYPWEQALLAAAHACRYRGQDLFSGKGFRGAVDGVLTLKNPIFGLKHERFVGWTYHGDGSEFGATGTPS